MKWIVFSVFILFQIFQAFGTRCRIPNGGIGKCMARDECIAMQTTSNMLTNCGMTGMICCPDIVPSVEPYFPEPKFPEPCGVTPLYPQNQFVGGKVIEPDEYSWIASLQYGDGNTFGACGGSVINTWYVLTAAHCVEGIDVVRKGGLTGVRLGDFTALPYCDYGSPNCSRYNHFEVHQTKVHDNYYRDREHNVHNDIALIKVNRKIEFNSVMMPVCLPFNISNPADGTMLVVSGWGVTMNMADKEIKKRAVSITLWNETACENQPRTVMCAGEISKRFAEKKASCQGDSGGPLMHNFDKKQMVIEGIVSFSHGNCIENYFPSYFTRVREYLVWIENNMYM